MTLPEQKDYAKKAEAVWYEVTSGAETYTVGDIRKPMLMAIAQALSATAKECTDEMERVREFIAPHESIEAYQLAWESLHDEAKAEIKRLTNLVERKHELCDEAMIGNLEKIAKLEGEIAPMYAERNQLRIDHDVAWESLRRIKEATGINSVAHMIAKETLEERGKES